MISLIVIGKNEEKNLVRCFKSIFTTISLNNIKKYEVIYVDSNSDDNSIEIAKEFKEIKIYKIISKVNAAIARNVGARNAVGDFFYFIDGDMEISPEFLSLVLDDNLHLKYDFVSGQFIDKICDYKQNVINEIPYYKNLNRDTFMITTGGIFLIKKEIWRLVNGMRIKYRRSQDLDFGLRLAKKGVLLLRKKEIITFHYTIGYNNIRRMWRMLSNFSIFYGNAVLYRDNMFNKNTYSLLFKNDSTLVLLIVIIFGSISFHTYSSFLVYILAAILRSFNSEKKSFMAKINKFFFIIVKDIFTILALFTFFPHINESEIEFLEIK